MNRAADASPLIAALDTADLDRALRWAAQLEPFCGLLKLGLEFFCARGPAGVALVRHPVFLDLKLHDIPATAAEQAAGRRIRLLAVTVLTSLGAAELSDTGISGGPRQQVLRLARLALAAGADGLVCSGHEVAMLRDAFGAAPLLVVPGIRPPGIATDDQARVMTPHQALTAGADYIVVGRPITQAADPGRAAAALLAACRQEPEPA
jgi:orotidine-5'-phosphate decarboxylase